MQYRNVSEDDYDYVIERLNSWWGGRNMADMLPRLFFTYFQTSSFLCAIDGKVVGFIVGFLSDSVRDTGYVHFVGVDPECRMQGVGKELYSKFSEFCAVNGVKIVKCVTSPQNTDSITFHHRLGFKASGYDSKGHPIPILNYDGPGEDRVLFSIQLGA
ncbi:MAG: GNAT family N-acetyltransferase [Ketobacter sp.]|nr:MAG: GNAT family N-acetyltransferase [Ketobacter sp.]